MAKQFDDDLVAKKAICDEPAITDVAKTKKPEAVKPVEAEPLPAEPVNSERDGRLLANGLSAVMEMIQDKPLGDDEKGALEEVGERFFSTFGQFALFSHLRIGFLAVCLVLPFVPPVWRIVKARQEKKEEGEKKDGK